MLDNIRHFLSKSVAPDECRKPLLAPDSESTRPEPKALSTQTITAAVHTVPKARLYTERTLAKEVQILEVIRIAWTSARMPGELTDELAETITKMIVTRDEAYQLLVHPYDRAILEDELRSLLSSIDGYDALFYEPLVHQLGNYVVWNWKARGMPCGATKAVIRRPPPEINISNRIKDVPGRDASVQDTMSFRQRQEHVRVRWEQSDHA